MGGDEVNGLDNIMDQTPQYTGIMVCIALEEAKVVLFMTDLSYKNERSQSSDRIIAS